MKRIKVVVSFSGGKDSCFALYKILKMRRYKVVCLLNFISEEFNRVHFHGATASLLRFQARALNLAILQKKTSRKNYEKKFLETLRLLKRKGIEAAVFGNIYLQEHKEWIEKMCKKVGLVSIEPLWRRNRKKLLREFVDAGFKTCVTSTQGNLLGKEWLGRVIDRKFINDLAKVKNVDICGENGEYHTFVFDGPIFKKRIKIAYGVKIKRDNHWFLDIKNMRQKIEHKFNVRKEVERNHSI